MIGVLKSKGVPVLWVGLPRSAGPQGNVGYAVPGCALTVTSPAKPASPMSMSGTDSSTKPAASCRRVPDFEGQIRQLRFLRRRVFHQARRAQARALRGTRGDPPAGRALRADRAADRTGNARRQTPCPVSRRRVRWRGPILPLVASSVGTDQLLGGPGSRPRRGRCAGGAHAGQGRAAGAARRPRRRFRLAAPRGRARTGQGRNAGRIRRAGWNGRGAGDTGPTAQAEEAGSAQSGQPSIQNFFGLGNPAPPRQAAPPSRAPGPPRRRAMSDGRSSVPTSSRGNSHHPGFTRTAGPGMMSC